MHHLEGKKVRWASKDEGASRQAGRQHEPSAEEWRRREREGGREKKKPSTNLDDPAQKLMAFVGCCRNLTVLRGPLRTINTVPDINNNT